MVAGLFFATNNHYLFMYTSKETIYLKP